MARIDPPRTGKGYPDRLLDCQMAAEFAFQDLVAEIIAAGWRKEEVALALCALAENHVLAMAANAETDAQIAQTKALMDGNGRK